MRALLQPDDTGLCAQTCVAMVANVSIEKAHAACGNTALYEAGSMLHEVKRGLRALGVRHGATISGFVHRGRKKVATRDIPKFCIAFVSDNKTAWSHAVVIKDGFVFDPAIGWPIPLWVYESFIIERAYARRFRRRAHRHKNVKAFWDQFLPILKAPTSDDIVQA